MPRAWKASALPLSYTRPRGRFAIALSRASTVRLVDGGQVAALPRDSHDEPGRHRCFLDRLPLVVAQRDACGAMARLID